MKCNKCEDIAVSGHTMCRLHLPRCQHCEKPVLHEFDTGCQNCIEVRSRISDFLLSEDNRRFLMEQLSKHHDFDSLYSDTP